MIQDSETNIVYFSEILKTNPRFATTCAKIIEILESKSVPYKFLTKTKDIWARDYMPIQVKENKFIEYRYDPDYLQGKLKNKRELKTYPDLVCETLNLKTIKSDIILDGGNVVKSSNAVILTNKVFKENEYSYTPKQLINKLSILFEVDMIIIIPWDKSERYGHADGMIRFIDDSTVLIQEYFDSYDEEFKRQFYNSLKQNGLSWEKLKYNVKKQDKRNWAYLNFLQTKDLILIPSLGIDEDEQALLQFKHYFPEYNHKGLIGQVDVTEIVKEDGALNCITWTIKHTA